MKYKPGYMRAKCPEIVLARVYQSQLWFSCLNLREFFVPRVILENASLVIDVYKVTLLPTPYIYIYVCVCVCVYVV